MDDGGGRRCNHPRPTGSDNLTDTTDTIQYSPAILGSLGWRDVTTKPYERRLLRDDDVCASNRQNVYGFGFKPHDNGSRYSAPSPTPKRCALASPAK
jgi:hypothetical protein